ncbi:MAG TPA: S41 family peptidase [Verrucomicrobiae bacterium]|nr:S41 family peptidase [Verrucomicrobiae bacterium]
MTPNSYARWQAHLRYAPQQGYQLSGCRFRLGVVLVYTILLSATGLAVQSGVEGETNAFSAESTAAAFDQLWQAFDKDYAMFVLRPEVDWNKLREEYRPKALASTSPREFTEVCAQLLQPLRDLHVWLTLDGQYVPIFNRPRSLNANPSAHRKILGGLHQEGRVRWAVTGEQVGFLAVDAWNGQGLPAQCDRVLEQMRNTRGLIVDVRLNGGGSEDLAGEVAGRFLKASFVYAYSRFRNGPSHSSLTDKIERRVAPRGPWRYDRPVVLLIGQKCMSSNESFVAMMSGDPDLVSIGDHTCGSSGNPEIINLPMNITVSVPRWIDYLPDGTPLDERGFQPQIRFDPPPGAFEGSRDELLTAALERLRLLPLPAQPIPSAANSPQSAFTVVPPVVIQTVPIAGAETVDPAISEIRVVFSKPMMDGSWSWSTWGEDTFPETIGPPRYLADGCTCVLSVKLEPGRFYATWLNSENFHNFKDTSGQPAVPYLLTFRTKPGP